MFTPTESKETDIKSVMTAVPRPARAIIGTTDKLLDELPLVI
jgi:hypothetical protein